jgi:protein ImuB
MPFSHVLYAAYQTFESTAVAKEQRDTPSYFCASAGRPTTGDALVPWRWQTTPQRVCLHDTCRDQYDPPTKPLSCADSVVESPPAPGTPRELPISELNQPGEDRGELVDTLRRLGLRTLGAFAALTERDVAGRFPRDAITAHRLARGLSERPPLRRALPPELSITEEFEYPLARVDEAAFVAKTLGERFFAGLARHGLACTRLAIVAVTEAGEERVRVWRCAEPLTARATADRVRWQCEGWLTARETDRPSAGIVRLRLDPEEVVGGQALQLQLGSMGRDADADERAGRALVRIQGLLGPDAVVTPLLDGGRGPAERVRLVPWGEPRRPVLEDQPWPGRLPAPSPTVVPRRSVPAVVLDSVGDAVCCSERGELSYPPALVGVDGGPQRQVLASAGRGSCARLCPGEDAVAGRWPAFR